MKKASFFYTEEQVKELKKVASTKESATSIAKRLSVQWKRSESGLYVKICNLRKTGGKLKKENKVAIPKGLSFNFNPSKAEMFKDRVILYF
jgi:hypothetical protein